MIFEDLIHDIKQGKFLENLNDEKIQYLSWIKMGENGNWSWIKGDDKTPRITRDQLIELIYTLEVFYAKEKERNEVEQALKKLDIDLYRDYGARLASFVTGPAGREGDMPSPFHFAVEKHPETNKKVLKNIIHEMRKHNQQGLLDLPLSIARDNRIATEVLLEEGFAHTDTSRVLLEKGFTDSDTSRANAAARIHFAYKSKDEKKHRKEEKREKEETRDNKLVLAPGQALLLLMDKYEKKNDTKTLEELKKLYLSGGDSLEAQKRIREFCNDPELLKNYRVDFSPHSINQDSTRRYFETHLAFETQKIVSEQINFDAIQKHFNSLYKEMEKANLYNFNHISNVLLGKFPTDPEEAHELIYTGQLTDFLRYKEFSDAIRRIGEDKNYDSFSPEQKEKIKNILKIMFLGVNLVMHSGANYPLAIYGQDVFSDKNRGTIHKDQDPVFMRTQHMGIMHGHHPLPFEDIAFTEKSFTALKPSDLSTFNPDAEWVKQNFNTLVNPFINSISGTMLTQIRLILFENLNNRLQFSSKDELFAFLKLCATSLLYASGGHSLKEFVATMMHPQTKEAFSFIQNFDTINVETLFHDNNSKAFELALKKTQLYNNQILKRKKTVSAIPKAWSQHLGKSVSIDSLIQVSEFYRGKLKTLDLASFSKNVCFFAKEKDKFYLITKDHDGQISKALVTATPKGIQLGQSPDNVISIHAPKDFDKHFKKYMKDSGIEPINERAYILDAITKNRLTKNDLMRCSTRTLIAGTAKNKKLTPLVFALLTRNIKAANDIYLEMESRVMRVDAKTNLESKRQAEDSATSKSVETKTSKEGPLPKDYEELKKKREEALLEQILLTMTTAIEHGDPSQIDMLVNSPLWNRMKGSTALHFSAKHGFKEAVKIILKNKTVRANLEQRTTDVHSHETALDAAIFSKNMNIAKQLLDAGSLIDELLIQIFIKAGNFPLVELLLDYPKQITNPTGQNYFYRGPILYGIEYNLPLSIMKKLISKYPDDLNKEYASKTPLMVAWESKNLPLFIFLLENGANLNASISLMIEKMESEKPDSNTIALYLKYPKEFQSVFEKRFDYFFERFLDATNKEQAMDRHQAIKDIQNSIKNRTLKMNFQLLKSSDTKEEASLIGKPEQKSSNELLMTTPPRGFPQKILSWDVFRFRDEFNAWNKPPVSIFETRKIDQNTKEQVISILRLLNNFDESQSIEDLTALHECLKNIMESKQPNQLKFICEPLADEVEEEMERVRAHTSRAKY